MPTVKIERIIASPPADVWPVISEIERLREWNPRWTNIQLTSETTHGTGASFRASTEAGDQFDFRITGWIEGEFVEISPVHDSDERHGITLQAQTMRIAPADEGTATWIEFAAHVSTHGPRGWLLGLVFWPGYQKRGLTEALNALEAVLVPPADEDAAAGDQSEDRE
jgi:uncharacterized protein YndB with AHSA1/START domain